MKIKIVVGSMEAFATLKNTKTASAVVNSLPFESVAHRCPVWTPDGKIFIFDSTRAGGFGGRDLWWVYFKDVKGYTPSSASTSSVPPVQR